MSCIVLLWNILTHLAAWNLTPASENLTSGAWLLGFLTYFHFRRLMLPPSLFPDSWLPLSLHHGCLSRPLLPPLVLSPAPSPSLDTSGPDLGHRSCLIRVKGKSRKSEISFGGHPSQSPDPESPRSHCLFWGWRKPPSPSSSGFHHHPPKWSYHVPEPTNIVERHKCKSLCLFLWKEAATGNGEMSGFSVGNLRF